MAVECHTSAQFKLTACPLETLVPQLSLFNASELAKLNDFLSNINWRHCCQNFRSLLGRPDPDFPFVSTCSTSTDGWRFKPVSHSRKMRVRRKCGTEAEILPIQEKHKGEHGSLLRVTVVAVLTGPGNLPGMYGQDIPTQSTFSRKSVVCDVTDLGDVTDIVQETVVAEGGAAFLGRPFNRVREESSALDRRATCMVTDIRCRGGLHEKPVGREPSLACMRQAGVVDIQAAMNEAPGGAAVTRPSRPAGRDRDAGSADVNV
ncbi:hypothetical protein Bbelb_365970 [Branchiostoma belcheri]|nr:hypothetical protein Bbelb_365970 [Branchiostoma belcheri]